MVNRLGRDVPSDNSSTLKHGYLKKLSGLATDFMGGTGLWTSIPLAGRTITGTANQITVTNGDGVSGNPTLSLPIAKTSCVRVVKAADQTTADYTAGGLVTWDTEHIDTDAWHSTVSNTSRLTVPTGVTVAEFSGAIAVDLSTANTWKNLYLYKNGSLYQVFWWNFTPIDVHWVGHFNSGPLSVAGDYFEVFFQEQSDASVTIKSAWSFFSAKALG